MSRADTLLAICSFILEYAIAGLPKPLGRNYAKRSKFEIEWIATALRASQ